MNFNYLYKYRRTLSTQFKKNNENSNYYKNDKYLIKSIFYNKKLIII